MLLSKLDNHLNYYLCFHFWTLLNLLYEGYDYIANDRLALKEENGQISVIGIPFSMGIILEDAVKLFDITGCKKAIDKDKKKVYLESNEVGRKFNVGTFSVIKLNTILLPKYNEEVETIEMQNVSDIVLYLGPDNIMTTNAIPEEKKFLNEMFDITYKDAIIIGLFQLIAAIFPGTSRSGATIVGALLIGVNKIAVKAHGNSTPDSFKCAIEIAYKLAKHDAVNQIKKEFVQWKTSKNY